MSYSKFTYRVNSIFYFFYFSCHKWNKSPPDIRAHPYESPQHSLQQRRILQRFTADELQFVLSYCKDAACRLDNFHLPFYVLFQNISMKNFYTYLINYSKEVIYRHSGKKQLFFHYWKQTRTPFKSIVTDLFFWPH